MELKVLCGCGQKYKFDVEPVNGLMPHAINCPICGLDGTAIANASLATVAVPVMVTPIIPPVESAPAAPMTAPVAPAPNAPPTGGLRINKPAMPPPQPASALASQTTPPTAPPPFRSAAAPATPKYMQTNKEAADNNFMMGILGGIGGAGVGVGAMIAFYLGTGLKLPLTGTLVGAAIGYGARLMYRGTSSSLGGVCAVIALLTIPTTLLLMFGVGAILFGVISIIVGVGMAFRIASD